MFARSLLSRQLFYPNPQTTRGIANKISTPVQVSTNNSIRCFRTSSSTKALPPHVAIILGKVFKYSSAVGGRVVRYWWQKLPLENKLKLIERTKKYKMVVVALLGGAGIGSYFYYDAHLQETPITKRKRFIAFTEEQFYKISKQQLQTLLKEYKRQIDFISLYEDKYKRVEHVATRLLKANLDLEQIQNKDWTITLIDDDKTMNAFVLTCGSIFVFTGLLRLLDTDDQLAVILGHEMAHAVLSHGCETASFLHLLDLFFIIPLGALWALLPMDSLAVLSHYISMKITKYFLELPYDRSLETEADEVGLYLAAKACFDVRAATLVWAKMSLLTDSDDPLDIEWLSTHPKSELRQTQLNELLPKAYKLRESSQCAALPMSDPRTEIDFWEMCKNPPEKECLLRLKIV